MENKEQLVKVIDFWQNVAREGILFPRNIVNKINLSSNAIIDIAGPRRSGKSSALKLLIRKLPPSSIWLYINFEDPFFIENNQAGIIEELIEVYKEYYAPNLKYLFFDEIQNIEKWEKAVRKLHESGNYKIFLTGSSSKLLSGELASLISGRHLSYEIMPLDFKEFLCFNKIELKERKDLILQKVKILKYFNRYLNLGGFPKIVLEKNEELLKQYYSDILEKDIIKRHEIRNKNIIEKMGIYLLSNAAKLLSIASLEKIFNLSFEVASTYLDYFNQAFLIFELPQFSYSLKTQQKALKKTYAVDTGLANSISFRFSEDRGRIFENCVFLKLRQTNAELFYYKTRTNLEIDFLVRQKKKKELIQVCTDLNDEKTKSREIKALSEAMEEMGLSNGLILTESNKSILRLKNKIIHVLPAYEYFCL